MAWGRTLALVYLVGLGLLVPIAWAGSSSPEVTMGCLVPMEFNVFPGAEGEAHFYVDKTKSTKAEGLVSLKSCFDYMLDVKEARNMQRMIMSIGKTDYSLPLSSHVSNELHTVSVSPAMAMDTTEGKLAVRVGTDGRSNSFVYDILTSMWQDRVGDFSRVAACLAADILKVKRAPSDSGLPGDGDKATQAVLSRFLYHAAREKSVAEGEDMYNAYKQAALELTQRLKGMDEQDYLHLVHNHLAKDGDKLITLKKDKKTNKVIYSYADPKKSPLEHFKSEMKDPSAADAFQILLRMLYMSQIGRYRTGKVNVKERGDGPAYEVIKELLDSSKDKTRNYNQLGQEFVNELDYSSAMVMKILVESMNWMKSCDDCMGEVASWFFGSAMDSFANIAGVDVHSKELKGKLAKTMQGIFEANFSEAMSPPKKKARDPIRGCNSPTICYLGRALALSLLERDPQVDWAAGTMKDGLPKNTNSAIARNAIIDFDAWAKTQTETSLDSSGADDFLNDIVQGQAEARKPVTGRPIENGSVAGVRVGSMLAGHRIAHVDPDVVIKMEEDAPSPEQIALAAINAEKHEI